MAMSWILPKIRMFAVLWALLANTSGYTDTKCTGEMLQLTCTTSRVIVVRTIFFGKSRTCTHGPWPAGCARQNHHFHPCTGLRLCTVKAPRLEIKGCGFNDYVHVEYDCLPGTSTIVCKVRVRLSARYGYDCL